MDESEDDDRFTEFGSDLGLSYSPASIKGQDESLTSYIDKLQELKALHIEKSVEKKLLKKIILNKQVSEYLHNHVLLPSLNTAEDHDTDDGSTSEEHRSRISNEQRLYLKRLLEEKKEINAKVIKITKENAKKDQSILDKKLSLRESMQARKTLWNEAAKLYEWMKRDRELEKSDTDVSSSGIPSANSSTDLDDETKVVRNEIADKIKRISDLSRILYLLIIFSGAEWGSNKHLLEIVLCTSKIMDIDLNNHSTFKKIVDDVIHRLNFVKI